MKDDDSDSDLNEIAYVGNDDDERGPGCLIGLAVALAFAGLIGLVIAIISAFAMGLFAGAAGGPGTVIGFGLIIILGIFGLFAGGAGVGMSLKALTQSRKQGRADLIGVAWLSFSLSVVVTVMAFGLALAIMIVIVGIR